LTVGIAVQAQTAVGKGGRPDRRLHGRLSLTTDVRKWRFGLPLYESSQFLSYQKYIDYPENIVIYYLKEELIRTLDRPDPPYNEDDRPVVRPMVFRTNTGCQDEYYITPTHVMRRRRTLH
jgi:hypothetical protein